MEDLDSFIKKHRKNEEKSSQFCDYLIEVMKKHGFDNDDPVVYKKANISRQNWHQIINGEVNPKLVTVIKIVFAIHANNHECKYLLKKAGYTLASSSDYALIIRYCLENEIYDLDVVNEYLEKHGYEKNLIY